MQHHILNRSSKRVAFLQLVHIAEDDRVFFHQRRSLVEAGCEVRVFSAMSEQMDSMGESLSAFAPDAIICDTPKAVHLARKEMPKARVVYDVTEWYPSKKNLRGLSFFRKSIKAVLLSFAFVYAGFLADAFLFGEYHKSLLLSRLFFWKRSLLLPYYPHTSYFASYGTKSDFSLWRLAYAGPLTTEKGYGRVLSVVEALARRMPEQQFELRVIGRNSNEIFQEPHLPNLAIEHSDYLPYTDFCNFLPSCDIFFDLRDDDMENTRCLPIKLFYYMAAGRVSFFSDLKAIRCGVPEFEDFSELCKPDDVEGIVTRLMQYIAAPALYEDRCRLARQWHDRKYNWSVLEEKFVKFVVND